ncbi:DUF2238 domain-containing protein [Paenibacillus filicis]|uniref:DUF2238 domain-containing protein n=1 Tax=Paenibacillus filicis TaxID=669464 RepID=A0ABU9DPJ8_9BACL
MEGHKPRRARGKGAALILLVGVYMMLWGWLAVAPASRSDWLLEQLLVIACLGVLGATYRRVPLSLASYAGIALFLALHAYGANTSYGATPIDPWLQRLFGGGRLPYDRLVHLCYGLLLAHPVREVLVRLTGVRGLAAYGYTVAVVLATGAFYELIEMWVTLLVAPELGALFLGSQGDPWDTHHDMELELAGSILAMALLALKRRIIPSST